jgi:DNA-directed RNA polymerase subunit M/transcription elongation factor TFIIS
MNAQGGICKVTKSTGWRNHKEFGRICNSCNSKTITRKIKIETLSHYSNGKMKCVTCGYNKNINGLELDHIEGKGSKDRRDMGSSGGWSFMKKLKKIGFPSGFQVLCATCNKIKQIESDPK